MMMTTTTTKRRSSSLSSSSMLFYYYFFFCLNAFLTIFAIFKVETTNAQQDRLVHSSRRDGNSAAYYQQQQQQNKGGKGDDDDDSSRTYSARRFAKQDTRGSSSYDPSRALLPSMLFHDGPSLEARFNKPFGVVASPDGRDVFIADTFNHRIRRIDVEFGTVTTLAGTGASGSADGLAKRGDATFKFPSGVAVSPDGGFVYVADTKNHKIRVIILGSGVVRTVAGSGLIGYHDDLVGTKARFNQPMDVVMHPDGHTLFVSDAMNNCIRKVDVQSGEVTTLTGNKLPGMIDGIKSNARFLQPMGMSCSTNTVLDGGGKSSNKCAFLAVADAGNHAVRLVNTETGAVVTLAGGKSRGYKGNALGIDTLFAKPTAVSFVPSSLSAMMAASSSSLFQSKKKEKEKVYVLVVDSGNGAVRKVPVFDDIAAAYPDGSKDDTSYEPNWENAGKVVDVTVVDKSNHIRDHLGRRSPTKSSFDVPFGISICLDSQRVYVTDRGNPSSIKLLDLERKLARTVAGALNVEFDHTQNENGDSLVDDTDDHEMTKHLTGIYDVRHRGGISNAASNKDSLHPKVVHEARTGESHSASAVWAEGVETNTLAMSHDSFYTHHGSMAGTFGSMMDKYEEAKMRAKNTSMGKRFIRWWVSLSLFMQVFYYLLFQVVWYIGLKYLCKKSAILNRFVEWTCEKSGYNRFAAWFYMKTKPLRDYLYPIFDVLYRRVVVRAVNAILPKLKLWYQKYPIIQKTIEVIKTFAIRIISAIQSVVSTIVFNKLLPFVQKYKIIVSMRLRRVSPKLAAFFDAIPNKLKELWRTIKVWFARMYNQFRSAYARHTSNNRNRSSNEPSMAPAASRVNGGMKSFAFSSATAQAMSRHPPASMSADVVRKLREQRGALNDDNNSRHRD